METSKRKNPRGIRPFGWLILCLLLLLGLGIWLLCLGLALPPAPVGFRI